VSEEGLQKAFEDFKVLADKKKEVYDEDIEAIIFNQSSEDVQHYEIDSVTITSGNASIPTATIRMKDMDGNYKTDASIGDGPVDAAMKAVERIAEIPGRLKSYKINAITAGKDAQGEVNLTAEFEECGYDVRGRGSDTDVVISSVKAYVDALNKYIARKETMTSKRTSGGI
jgi:2-isopropylmalate synthase